jgi:WhiB family redox-sensing transcriptional regulator
VSTGALAAWGTSTAGPNDWRDEAACLDHDAELFFPIGTTGPAVRQIAAAVAVCTPCPVRAQCLRYALDNREEHGVWGGLGEDDRRSFKRRLDRARAAAERAGQPAPDPTTEPGPHLLDAAPVRDIIRDRRDHGWSFMEIARRLEVSESTARALAADERTFVTQRVADAAKALLVGAE